MTDRAETFPALQGIVREAYEVFAGPRPRDVEVCTACCMDPEMAREFFNYENSELPEDFLHSWFNAAKPKEVSLELWRYLLPRVMDSLSRGEEATLIGDVVVLRPFPTGDCERWSEQEWSVIDRFQRAYLDHAHEIHNGNLDDVICMFALGGWNADKIWAQVMAWPDEKIARVLHHDWCANNVTGSIWVSAFWPKPDGAAAMKARYTKGPLADRMITLAFDKSAHEETRDKALAVADVIYSAIN